MTVRSFLARLFPPRRPALVVGATAAARRLAQLAAASGRPVIVFDTTDVAPHQQPGADVRQGTPQEADIETADLLLVATGDTATDERMAAKAVALAVPVHVYDRPDLSTFALTDLADGTVRPQDRLWLRNHPYM